jgi:hypothetical protein
VKIEEPTAKEMLIGTGHRGCFVPVASTGTKWSQHPVLNMSPIEEKMQMGVRIRTHNLNSPM